MNATMVQIAQEGNIIPLIDGGTEGRLDQAPESHLLMNRFQGAVEGYSTYCQCLL